MKQAILILLGGLVILSPTWSQSPGVAINPTMTPADPSAMLDVSSTTSGLLVPRMTDPERDAIVNPAEGLLIFNTTSKCFNVFKFSSWFEWCGNCITPPAPVVGSNSPLCEGGSLQLTASAVPNATWQWTGPNGFSSTEQNPVISSATASNSGAYAVVASTPGCQSQPVPATVIIDPLPSPANAGPDQTGIPGSSTTLAATPPSVGSGTWSILSGSGGSFGSPSSPGSLFSGNVGETYTLRWTVANACGSSHDDVTVSFSAGGPRRVFMTSTTYNANLGGVAGANSKCQDRANAASLGGNWKAWISTSTSSPSTTFTQSSYPYVMTNGTQIASNWNDLTNGSISTTININEFGNVVPFNGSGSFPSCGSWLGGYFIMHWSSTKADGTYNPPSGSCHTTCSDWTGTTGGGDIWIQWNNRNTASCGDALYRLLCFEQ